MKNKRKSEQKWVRLWAQQSSGTVKLFSDSCFDFEICDFVCECVFILWDKQVNLVVLSNDTAILLYISLTMAFVRSLPIVTTCNHPFFAMSVWSAAVYATCWMMPLSAAHHQMKPEKKEQRTVLAEKKPQNKTRKLICNVFSYKIKPLLFSL